MIGGCIFCYQLINMQRTRHGCTRHTPLITCCTCLQVSCFGSNAESDAGDDWLVEWETKKQGKTWQQDVPVWYVEPCCCGRRGKGGQALTTVLDLTTGESLGSTSMHVHLCKRLGQ